MTNHGVVQVQTLYGGAAPGISRFRVTNASLTPLTASQAYLAINSLHTGYGSVVAQTPDTVDYQFNMVVQNLDDATGEIVSEVTGTPSEANVVGTDTGNYASGVGARVRFETAARFRSRPVYGGIMLVPLAGGAYGLNGNLTSSALAGIQDAFAYILSNFAANGLTPVIWSKPKIARGVYPASVGFSTPVTNSTVDPMPAVLRRRRV